MTKLSPHAKQALDLLTDKHNAFLMAKAVIEAELRDEFTRRISQARNERDTALRLADSAGVPRTQLGKAIGTTNYRTVQEILANIGSSEVSVADPDGKWILSHLDNNQVSVTIRDLGIGHVSGTAVFNIVDGQPVFVSGDEFVLPQIYRNGLADDIFR